MIKMGDKKINTPKEAKISINLLMKDLYIITDLS